MNVLIVNDITYCVIESLINWTTNLTKTSLLHTKMKITNWTL